ncbi:hypothetical protein B0H13DRAFT_2336611 [Mycena leptocephala]|nr:hypothetical protein B0H13DRAFT_2336611 [Mycena leptocephala]
MVLSRILFIVLSACSIVKSGILLENNTMVIYGPTPELPPPPRDTYRLAGRIICLPNSHVRVSKDTTVRNIGTDSARLLGTVIYITQIPNQTNEVYRVECFGPNFESLIIIHRGPNVTSIASNSTFSNSNGTHSSGPNVTSTTSNSTFGNANGTYFSSEFVVDLVGTHTAQGNYSVLLREYTLCDRPQTKCCTMRHDGVIVMEPKGTTPQQNQSFVMEEMPFGPAPKDLAQFKQEALSELETDPAESAAVASGTATSGISATASATASSAM